MRIDAVKAIAFGPFVGDTLKLTPGMNVIYGPNESGKSSWHGALYAALCGMKKTRGQPTRDDRAFANRHRPWRGSGWRVSALVTLDNGETVEIDQGLAPGGRSVATDRATKKTLGGDLVRAGAVDATTLLGLTREIALATVFVRQADLLRVLADAGALQEYLERAAATSTADATADEALSRISTYKKDQVGVVRVGARGPLAAATRQLTEAEHHLDEAEARFESYQKLLTRRQGVETAVHRLERQLHELIEHERERERRGLWDEIRAAEDRLRQARQLLQQVVDTDTQVADKQLITAATRALATYDARPEISVEQEGPTAAELEAELATIPDVPIGDLEPDAEVIAKLEEWRSVRHRLTAHREIEPSATGARIPPIAPTELRRLADDLETPIPQVDADLADEISRARAGAPDIATARPAGPATLNRKSPIPLIAGSALAVGGIAFLVLGQPVVGLVLIVLGIGLAIVAAVIGKRSASATGSGCDAPSASPPLAAPELPRLEARLALQQELRAQAERRRESAENRVEQLSMPTDSNELRRLAAEADVATASEARREDWQQRYTAIETSLQSAAEALAAALIGRTDIDQNDLERTFDAYAQHCRERSATAQRASRKSDLEAQLVTRRAAEAAREQDRSRREAAEQELRAVATDADCEAAALDDLAYALRGWVQAQEAASQTRQHHEKALARLDQLLDGRTIEQLEVDAADMRASAGDPPADDAPPLRDRSAELTRIQARTREQREALAELAGQIEGSEEHLLDVSPAIEGEARAAAEVARLTALSEDLDLASKILGAAQEKVHADIAPVLNDTIRPWVSRITGGHYDDIRVDPATLEIQAHEPGGEFRSATVLSHGTTEQLFLLLRLALAQRVATTGEKAPIILDDVTVQSDAERTVAALELLHELSAEHQVVLFSQEDEVLRWAESKLKSARDQLVHLVTTA